METNEAPEETGLENDAGGETQEISDTLNLALAASRVYNEAKDGPGRNKPGFKARQRAAREEQLRLTLFMQTMAAQSLDSVLETKLGMDKQARRTLYINVTALLTHLVLILGISGGV